MGGWDAPWHWVVLAIVVIALFGYRKLPDAARSLGRSLRIFKTEIKGMSEDDKARAKAREEAEQKALPTADVVKRDAKADDTRVDDVPRTRPRPSPAPNGRAQTPARSD
jgi:sec-independent protein translocase protein TatA